VEAVAAPECDGARKSGGHSRPRSRCATLTVRP
jgi:hypothetical protein